MEPGCYNYNVEDVRIYADPDDFGGCNGQVPIVWLVGTNNQVRGPFDLESYGSIEVNGVTWSRWRIANPPVCECFNAVSVTVWADFTYQATGGRSF